MRSRKLIKLMDESHSRLEILVNLIQTRLDHRNNRSVMFRHQCIGVSAPVRLEGSVELVARIMQLILDLGCECIVGFILVGQSFTQRIQLGRNLKIESVTRTARNA